MTSKKEEVEPVKRCQVTIYGRNVWEKPTPCGNKAKGNLKDGTPACGIHLRSERIRNEKMETWEKHWAESDAFKQKVDEFVQANGIEESISIPEVDKVSISWELFRRLVLGKKLGTSNLMVEKASPLRATRFSMTDDEVSHGTVTDKGMVWDDEK
jgi:hypothetical protein